MITIIFYVKQISDGYYRALSLRMNSYYDLPGHYIKFSNNFKFSLVAGNVYIPSVQVPPV